MDAIHEKKRLKSLPKHNMKRMLPTTITPWTSKETGKLIKPLYILTIQDKGGTNLSVGGPQSPRFLFAAPLLVQRNRPRLLWVTAYPQNPQLQALILDLTAAAREFLPALDSLHCERNFRFLFLWKRLYREKKKNNISKNDYMFEDRKTKLVIFLTLSSGYALALLRVLLIF